MAREVYFDPFGQYARGHQAGVSTEMALQKGVRDARTQDWDYYNMAPLRLNTALRDDAVGDAAQPYRLKMPKVLYDNTLAQSVSQRMQDLAPVTQLGIPQPQANVLRDIYGYDYTQDPQGNFQYTDPTGQSIGPNLTLEDFLMSNPAFRKEGYDRSDTRFNQGLQGRQLTNDDMRAEAYTYSVQAQADSQRVAQENARLKAIADAQAAGGGGAAGGYNSWVIAPGTEYHSLLFGPSSAGQPQPNTPYYANPGRQGPLPGVGAPLAQPTPQAILPPGGLAGTTAPPMDTPEQRWAALYTRYPNAPRLTIEQMRAMQPEQQDAFIRTYMPELAAQAGQ